MTTRRTLLQGGAALAASTLLPAIPALASPLQGHLEYLRRVHDHFRNRWRACFVLHIQTDPEDQRLFLAASSMVYRQITDRVLMLRVRKYDSPPTIDDTMWIVAETLNDWMLSRHFPPITDPWRTAFPRWIKDDILRLLMRQPADMEQSIAETERFMHGLLWAHPLPEAQA